LIVVVSAVAFSWFGLDLGKPKSLSRSDISCSVKAMNFSQHLPSIGLLLAATTLEVSGDAVVRMAIYNHTGFGRLGLMLAGAVLLLGYGFSLNLAPMEFGQVVGLYITTLFVVWQVINFIAFRAIPTLPILVGGALIIPGGLIITFWKTQPWPSV
jgi:hypothetical protein